MNPRLRRVVSLSRDIVQEVREENIKFMAGSIAYHSFVSLLPVLLLLTVIVSTVGGQQLAEQLVQEIGSYLPASANIFLRNAITGAPSPGDSIVVVGVLLWGTFRIFRALDAAFADIYDVERKTSFVDELEDGIVVLVALIIVVVTIGVTSATLPTPQRVPFDSSLTEIVSVLALGVAFFPMYYVFPNIDVSIREVLPGVIIAAVGWQLLHAIFHMYAQVSAYNTSLYGTIGNLLLVIVWLYVGSFVILFGAAVTPSCRTDRRPDRGNRGRSDTERRCRGRRGVRRGAPSTHRTGARERCFVGRDTEAVAGGTDVDGRRREGKRNQWRERR
ncbi:YihY/virulence factor BrkB family protein [Haladaptatus sp. R4]|uniref:YihY/virulence factor BrkB family protein n=1 Tax=Haladaptatus sp. R4 TaxID=1679489 RepID=UPI000A89E3C3|nr:YihY/virulence factor BrkB family protein [Haladaptatus sp. R4]